MTAVHLTVWDETRAGADAVLLVHGPMTWGTACFEAQRPLARHYRLLVMDRRGFGESPDIDRSDYEVDAADVVESLGDGAHLVGHSYGGVVAQAGNKRYLGECFPPISCLRWRTANGLRANKRGAGHEPHRERPELVNTTLRDL